MCVKTAVSDRFTVFKLGDDSFLITNINDPKNKMIIEACINTISNDILETFQAFGGVND